MYWVDLRINADPGGSNMTSGELQLDALIEDGTLTGKKAKLLKASIKKGKKNNEKAHKLLCKLVDKGKGQGDSSSAAEHLAQNARNFADLATAQVFGVTTRHTDHVYDWFDW